MPRPDIEAKVQMTKQANGVEADGPIEEEAALWVARLQSTDATERDRQEFEIWKSADPRREAAYDDLRGLWTELRAIKINASPSKARPPLASVAARTSTILCLFGAVAFSLDYLGYIDRLRADYYTSVGEVRRVTLDDGTQVDLNTDTAISVHYSAGERRVELLRGEAFFDVTKNPDRPFTVADHTLTARALGTHYAVQTGHDENDQRVQVEEGVVEVQTDGDRAVLEAGESASLGEGTRLVVAKSDVSRDTEWRNGRLVFSDQPLKDVLATLSRYRRGKIVVADQAAASQRVSGIFDLRKTDETLRFVEDNLGLSVTRLTDMLVIIRSR